MKNIKGENLCYRNLSVHGKIYSIFRAEYAEENIGISVVGVSALYVRFVFLQNRCNCVVSILLS
jgi:hypothetical protein